jgi:hypothetical protein
MQIGKWTFAVKKVLDWHLNTSHLLVVEDHLDEPL